MTYCVAICVNEGLVMVSDSRTNAGIDNVSTYSKMRTFGVPGERQLVICSAGNLATTQSVFLQIERDIAASASENLMNVKSVSDAASYIGRISVEHQNRTKDRAGFEATFLIGGEILDARCRMFMIYSEGNYIASSTQTPYLQIGEIKYGKPILDRVIQADMSLEQAALCALVSMDATTRSNLGVGPPIELSLYTTGSLQPARYTRFDEDSEYLRKLRRAWNKEIRTAFNRLPAIDWNEVAD